MRPGMGESLDAGSMGDCGLTAPIRETLPSAAQPVRVASAIPAEPPRALDKTAQTSVKEAYADGVTVLA